MFTRAAATAYANRALRLSPFDPVAFAAHGALGHVAFQEERYDEAASCYDKAVQANPRFSLYYFAQAIALALAGRLEEARPIVGQGLELNPGVDARSMHAFTKFARGVEEFHTKWARAALHQKRSQAGPLCT
jgi:tetratricopeptide (TPR) repeat protein